MKLETTWRQDKSSSWVVLTNHLPGMSLGLLRSGLSSALWQAFETSVKLQPKTNYSFIYAGFTSLYLRLSDFSNIWDANSMPTKGNITLTGASHNMAVDILILCSETRIPAIEVSIWMFWNRDGSSWPVPRLEIFSILFNAFLDWLAVGF